MQLGVVCGTVHSTINHEFYENRRILIADLIDPDGGRTGNYIIAIDTVEAGAGETVLIIDEGNSARQIVNDSNAPIRSIIVGIIDEIKVEHAS